MLREVSPSLLTQNLSGSLCCHLDEDVLKAAQRVEQGRNVVQVRALCNGVFPKVAKQVARR